MVSFITDKSDTSLGWLEIVKSHGIEINQREINDLNNVGVVFVGDNLCAGLNCMISENQFMGGHDFNIYK